MTEGHPDKIADQISDSVLDALLAQDPKSRVACETLVSTGFAIIAGEITTQAVVDYPILVRNTIADINKTIAKLDDGKKVFYLDIGKGFLDASGNIPADVMSDGLHPTAKGYEIWAQAVIEPLTALMAGRAPPGR